MLQFVPFLLYLGITNSKVLFLKEQKMEWATIILGLLGPFLAKCHSQSEKAAQDPKEYLKENYDESTGKMDESLVRRSMASTRKAIKKAKKGASREERKTFPHYSRDEIYQMTEKKLVEAMNAPPEQVASAFAVAATLTDE
jgi:hypothetical protein